MAKILIADDSFSARKFITYLLKKTGHEIFEAEDGQTCINLVKEEKPDLVILDIVMPEKEGIETILVLKNTLPELPVIAISGAALNESYLSSAKKFGADAVLTKPFTKEQLTEAIDKILK